jgi:hypothetical protein
VLCSLTDTAGTAVRLAAALITAASGEAGGCGVGRGGVAALGGRRSGGDWGGESSERRAKTWVSGTELRRPYLTEERIIWIK